MTEHDDQFSYDTDRSDQIILVNTQVPNNFNFELIKHEIKHIQ